MTELLITPTNPDTDYSRLAQIIGTAFQKSSSPERLLHRDGQMLTDDVFEQYTVRVDKKIVAYCNIFKSIMVKIPHMEIVVIVDEDERGQGYGSQVYEFILTRANHYAVEFLVSNCLEDNPQSLRFAEKRGFRIQYHTFESVLDIATFDMAYHRASVTTVEQTGIRFSSLVAEGNIDTNLHKLFKLNTTVAQDEPTYDGSAQHSYDTWKARIAGSDWFYPPGQILAIDGDDYVGLGAIGFEPNGQAFNAFTGVLPGYRGLKIAQALKCKGIEFAQVVGAKTIRTGNDSRNVPMLAINNKFGYQRRPGVYRLRKNL